MRGTWGKSCSSILLAVAFAFAPSFAATKSFRPDTGLSFGFLQVDVPDGWTAKTDPDWTSGWTLSFRPPGPRQFILLVTPMPTTEPAPLEARCASARKVGSGSRDRMQKIAVEPSVSLQESKGTGGNCLYYATATDKTVSTPSAKDFKYGTQGAAMVGRLLCSFTLLDNVADSAERKLALEMLRNARHVGAPADPQAPGTAAARLQYTGKPWGLGVDYSGLQFLFPKSNSRGAMLFPATGPDSVMNIYFEPAKSGNDPHTYRKQYREQALANAPIKAEAIREEDREGMALLLYSIAPTSSAREQSLNAFLVHDGLWIHVEVATHANQAQADKEFARLLSSLRFID